MNQYLALLRGINVGGKNVIRMEDLRACLRDAGFQDVSTYIQSGNVVFRSRSARAGLARRIERLLAGVFDYRGSVVLRSRQQLQRIVARAPAGFGERPAEFRYDVLFLKDRLSAATVLQGVLTKHGVDKAHAGSGVIYFSRLTRRASQSRFARIVSLPLYQDLTVRNWRTTTKLLSMMEGSGR